MQKEEVKKLWFYTIIFCSLCFLILPVFKSFEPGTGIISGVVRAAGSIIMCLVLIYYPRFMIRWFRQMQAEGKSGDWEFLIARWTRVLWFGIFLSLMLVIGALVSFVVAFP